MGLQIDTIMMQYICVTMGTTVTSYLTDVAMSHGPLGSILVFIITMLLFFIPLVYLEAVIGQFTSRDCIDVWKIRPLFSHVGYIMLIWQLLVVINSQVSTSFSLYYAFASVSYPIPYYICGYWSDPTCDISRTNYTVNHYCLKKDFKRPYFCTDIYKTYPVHQFWIRFILKLEADEQIIPTTISWNIIYMSAGIAFIVFMSCFKKEWSLKFCLYVITFYPMVGYMVLLFGVLVQKGVTLNSSYVYDTSFQRYLKNVDIPGMICQVFFSTAVGSGVLTNLASRSSFRSPTYSYSAIGMTSSVVFSVVSITVMTLALCPFAYQHNVDPTKIQIGKMRFTYETVPHLMFYFSDREVWLVMFYTSSVCLGLRTLVVVSYNFIIMLSDRYKIVSRFHGVTCFLYSLTLFLITIPVLGPSGFILVMNHFNEYMTTTSTFLVCLECWVFIMWYGPNRFFEDIHFMHGIRSGKYLKTVWILAPFVSGYLFTKEMILCVKSGFKNNDLYSIAGLFFTVGSVFSIAIIKIIWALYKNNFSELLRLDPTWNPKDSETQRSRAMFTAQAMTKEYLYRQYHLKAGIVRRQKRANMRREWVDERQNIDRNMTR